VSGSHEGTQARLCVDVITYSISQNGREQCGTGLYHPA
jgi:hypothetical protein